MAQETLESIIQKKKKEREALTLVSDVIISLTKLHNLNINEVIAYLEYKWKP